MNKDSFLLKFILFLTSLVFCFILIEVAWRIIIFSNIGVFESQKKAELYADPYSEDDYWKLKYLFKKNRIDKQKRDIKERNIDLPSQHNEKLFTRLIFQDTYKHTNFKYVNDRKPVLLYGDSFAACYAEDGCFDHILNNDNAFSEHHYLLNYGVGGYGLDQIYFLFKNSIDNYHNPFVVMSLMILDLDRSILTVRDVPKTYYTIENNVLKLHERPSPYPDIKSFYSNNKPEIKSYFYRRVLYSSILNKLIPDQIVSYLKKKEYYKRKKIQINNKIMTEIIKELKKRDIESVFLIFHPMWIRGVGLMNENVTDWRSDFIRNILDENSIPYIWSKDIIIQNMEDENFSLQDYFIPIDGHPTTLQKELLAKKIKEFVLASESSVNIEHEN
jgi:hypothetical protein